MSKPIDPNRDGKICPSCGLFRKREEFGPSRARKDNMQTRCRDCRLSALEAKRIKAKPAEVIPIRNLFDARSIAGEMILLRQRVTELQVKCTEQLEENRKLKAELKSLRGEG